MIAPWSHSDSPTLPPAVRRVLLLADVLESVRLNQQFGHDFALRWMRFVAEVREHVLPRFGGRMVKSTGDGFLLTFQAEPAAAAAALDLQRRIAGYNADRAAEACMFLRIGVTAGRVTEAPFDVFGPPVDLAQRLSSAAAPGEVFIDVGVADSLVPGVDGEIHDLGGLYFKGHADSVRVFRLGPQSARWSISSLVARRAAELRPTIAVLPFECHFGPDASDHLGEALADEVILQLSRSSEMHVISALSARRLKRRGLEPTAAAERLDATLLLSGGYRMLPSSVALNIKLLDARDGTVLYAQHYDTAVHAAFDPADPLAHRIVHEVCHAIFQRAVKVAASTPMPALESYALLFAAIGLMHRASRREFERAHGLLEHLANRQGGRGVAHAWIAKWHVLRSVQGWSEDPHSESRLALDHVRRSLDLDPENALALTLGGLAHAYLLGDAATAGHMYEQALLANPCEPMAWLCSATRHAYLGQGAQAQQAAENALMYSPIDPLRYFFDSLAATALAGNGQWQASEQLSRRSIQVNRMHASTWRTLVWALVEQGRVDEARRAAEELQRIDPAYTVRRLREVSPVRVGPMLEPWARALEISGVPKG
jgi:TolB-like protein/class 3 adenylate cyclase